MIAQTPVAPTQPPTFRADTRLVEVNVIVHDKSGQPVAGLTRGDFTLLEDGKEQPIDVFSVEGIEDRPSPAVAAAPATTVSAAGIDVDNHNTRSLRSEA